MVYNRAQLKQDVKLSMKRTRPRPMLVALLFTAVVSVGTWLINLILGRLLTGGVGSISDMVQLYLLQGYEVEYAVQIALLELFRRGAGAIFGAVVGGMVLSIIVSLWQSTMGVGFESYCLSMVRGENPPMGKIFSALPQLAQVLVTRILTGIFEVLWSIPVMAVCTLLACGAILVGVPALTGLLVWADSILMMVGIIWVTMRYALVDFLLVDKGLSGLDAIRESKRLMKGNIGRGTVLQLSFFGWYLLVMIIVYAGIALAVIPIMMQLSSMNGLIAASGFALLVLAAVTIVVAVIVLWLQPYTAGAMAKLYDWICGRQDGFSNGSGFGSGDNGDGGWGEKTTYTWTTGPSSGTGTGSGGLPPKPPKPRDDPWN